MVCDSEYGIKKNLKWANKKLRGIIGGDAFWFDYNRATHTFEFWEKRGPMQQMVFPVNVARRALPEISEWEIEHAINFIRSSRSPENEDVWLKHKKYKQWRPDA